MALFRSFMIYDMHDTKQTIKFQTTRNIHTKKHIY
jgi:hypothetical protein